MQWKQLASTSAAPGSAGRAWATFRQQDLTDGLDPATSTPDKQQDQLIQLLGNLGQLIARW